MWVVLLVIFLWVTFIRKVVIFSLFVDFLLPLYFSPHLTLHSSIVPPLSDIDIPLEMGVYSCNSPQQAESTRADTPTQEIVSSSQSTPPPKRNKVGAHQWGFSVWTAVNDRSDNCRLWLLIQYVDGLTGFSSVKSFTCSPSTACVSRSTWRPSVTPMRSSSCQTQNDLRPLSVPQIVPPVTCILGFPENAPFWGPCLSAGLLKSFFFFFQILAELNVIQTATYRCGKTGKIMNLVHRVS